MSAPVENVLSRLEDLKPTGQGRWIAKCPAHSDRSPSLSIREADDSRVLLHCFSGCSIESVVDSIGLRVADLFPPRPHYRPGQRAIEPRIAAIDALRCLAHESTILCLAAEQLGRGQRLNSADMDRLSIAISRIQMAREVAA